MQHRAVSAVLAAAALLLTAGCSSDGGGGGPSAGADSAPRVVRRRVRRPPGEPPSRHPPAKGSVKAVRTVAEGLDTPWGLAPLPDGDLLVSSRDEGTITRIDGQTGKKTELGEVPGVSPAGEGGLLGIAISPDYASDHMIYAYFTSASDNRIVRMLFDEKKPAGEQLGAPDTIFKGHPQGRDPQRRPDRFRTGPDAVRGHGREREHRPVPGHEVPGRQDPPADPGGRTGAGKPLPGLPRVLVRPPQCAGSGLGLRAAAVRLGVRPGHLGRTERDQAGRELRLAGRRRAGRTAPSTRTRWPSGTRTTPPRAASPTPRGPSGWPA